MTTRRHFTRLLGTSAALAAFAPGLRAQPVEGTHYQRLAVPQPTRDPKRIEVLEFFAYSCHHCHDLEPALEAWRKTFPADVLFRRVPVAFREDLVIHNALYFALEALNLLDRVHGKVFEAVHSSRSGLKTAAEIGTFLQAQGVAPEPVLQAMRSFAVSAKVKQALEQANNYAIEGTPTLAVDGRWVTDGAMAGSNVASLAVAGHLIGVTRSR